MAQIKTQRLSIFLLKTTVSNYEDCLDGDVSHEYDIDKKLFIAGKIFVGNERVKQPDWVSFLEQGTANKASLPELENSSNRAVIIIHEQNRFWAIPFGYGRYMIREDVIESRFGMKVVLNVVDPDKLLSIDMTRLNDLSVHARMQATRNSGKDDFGYDIVNNLMQAVTGVPNDPILGSVVSGREQVVVNPKIEFVGIKTLLQTLLIHYKKKDYLRSFEWIDDVLEESDPNIITELNEKLLEVLNNRTVGNISFAPPQPIDWTEIDGFSYTNKGDKVIDLSIEGFYDSLDAGFVITMEFLKYRYVYVWDIKAGGPLSKWSSSNCLNVDVTHKKHRYVLAQGQWYRIDKNLVDETVEAVRNIKTSKIKFAECKTDEKEQTYNERLVLLNKDNMVLLDRQNIKCKSARTEIEPCDVFTLNKEFVHIKTKSSSATLSHLFAQGKISAEAFAGDDTFRRILKSKVASLKKDFESLVPEVMPNSREFTVVFAIIDHSDKPIHESLPFFSLLNLKLTADHLRMLGFKVSVAKIQRV